MDERSTQPGMRPASDHRRDLALVEQVLNGETAAREAFLERMKCVGRILSVRNARMGRPLNDDELADVTQETLLQIWRKLETYSGRASIETWVYGFCSLEILSYLRKRARMPSTLEDVPEPVDESEPAEASDPATQAAGIERWVRHLARREAEVVRLHHVDQLDYEEIGELLAISKSSVKTHYYRALEKLRTLLPNTPPRDEGASA